MGFYDKVLFPILLAEGSSRTLAHSTSIQKTPGIVVRVQMADEPRKEYRVELQTLRDDQAAAIDRHMRIVEGGAHGFRFVDPTDFSSGPTGTDRIPPVNVIGFPQIPADFLQPLAGPVDGSNATFQMVREFKDPLDGTKAKTKVIRKPLRYEEAQTDEYGWLAEVPETEVQSILVDGIVQPDAVINYETGEVHLALPPQEGQVPQWAGYYATPVYIGPETDKQFRRVMAGQTQNEGTTSDWGFVNEFDALHMYEDLHPTRRPPDRSPEGFSYFAPVNFHYLLFSDGFFQMFDTSASNPELVVRLPEGNSEILGADLFELVHIDGDNTMKLENASGGLVGDIGKGKRVRLHLGLDASGNFLWVLDT